MMKLSKIKIRLILLTFLLIILVSPQSVFSEISSQKMNQIITLNGSRLDVSSITEFSIKGAPIRSIAFTFPKIWQITNFRAYDNDSSVPLNMTFDKNHSNSSIKIIVNFPIKYENETYRFVSNYSRLYQKSKGRTKLFHWAWGKGYQPIELSYSIKIPGFVEIVYTNNTYNQILEKNYTIISTKGIAEPNKYFEFLFYYRNLKPPKLELYKYPTSTEIIEDKTFIVCVKILNTGGVVAKNVSISNTIPGVFKQESESFKNTDIQPGESKEFKYVLRGISASENELIGETIAVYTDESGENEYYSTSNQFNVTISKSPYVIEFFGIKIPINIDNPFPLIYNFLMGYLVLFSIYIVRKRSTLKWNSISSLDKMIYSVICSLINFIISLFMGLILLLLLIPFLHILEISTIDPVLLFCYLFPLLFFIITSTFIDKLIEKINTGEVNIIDIILRFLLRNRKWIVILYLGLLLLAFLKYILFA